MGLMRIFALLVLGFLPQLAFALGPDDENTGKGSFMQAQPAPSEPVQTPPLTPMELQAQPSPTPPPVENYTSSFFKMLSALVVLLLAVVLVVWLFKSIARGRFSRPSSARIEIIERRALSQKSMLYLIEVDGARILIAESQLEVRPLFQESAARVKES